MKSYHPPNSPRPSGRFCCPLDGDHQNQTWANLKAELQSCFGEIMDRSIAFSMLRCIHQERNESV